MRPFLIVFALCLTVCGCTAMTESPSTRSGGDNSTEDIEQLQSQLIELRKELDAANNRSSELKAEIANSKEQFKASEAKFDAAQQEIQALNTRLATAGSSLGQLLKNSDDNKLILSELQETLSSYLTESDQQSEVAVKPGSVDNTANESGQIDSENQADAKK